MRRCVLLVVLLLLIPAPAMSQDSGGVIVIGTTWDVDTIAPLNPLLCASPVCEQLSKLLFPHLIGIDPAAGVFVDTGDPTALANGWDISGSTYTFQLRNDLVWNDGEPITAYDVVYTYMAAASDQVGSNQYHDPLRSLVRAVVPTDDHTIVFILKSPTCSALNWLDLPILPAHVFDPEFAARAAAAFSDDGVPEDQYDEWIDAEPWASYSTIEWFAPGSSHPVTGGTFEYVDQWPSTYFRVRSVTGDPVLSYVPVASETDRVDQFLNGELTLLENPPFPRWNDIRAVSDIQIYEYPGRTWFGISLNLADPREPESAFDEDGNPLEQGQHPIFGDVRVRRALQLAIDIPALMDATVEGNGTIMNASQIPTSPAYNSDLAPVGTDLEEARRLLNEAGWKDINSDTILECSGCLYARPGSQLDFALWYDSRVPSALPELLQRQWARIGVSVSYGTASSSVSDQRYDAYLFARTESYPINPDQSIYFTQAQDVLHTGLNFGSYTNPEIESLFEEATRVPDCDIIERAEIYREIEAILQEDQPYLWLFVVNEMAAVQGGVLNFEPYPNAPFWNLHEWRVIH